MSRRGHNEGSIFRRNDGRWASTIDLGWQAGKRRRKTYYGRTRVEVQAKLIDALRSLRDNVPILDDRQTTSNYLAIWLETSATVSEAEDVQVLRGNRKPSSVPSVGPYSASETCAARRSEYYQS